MKHARDYRAMARTQLGNDIFGRLWVYALLAALVASIFVAIGAHSGFGVGAVFAEGFFMIGLGGIFLGLARGSGKVEFSEFFAAKRNVGEALLLGFFKTLFIALWSLLFVIPGLVKTYSYSMAYYIAYDHPEYTWRQCIDESRRLMDGNKWRLFCLHLSFLGWIIVGALCLGIGILWVIPYMEAAQANFYCDLVGGAPAPAADPAEDPAV